MTSKARLAGLALSMALSMLSRATAAGTPHPTPSQVERLAGLAKLWGAIKFFHPYVAEHNIEWDSALIQTIPKVESASSPEAYRKAIDYLLSFLHDPGTHTISKLPAADSNPTAPPGPAQPY